MAWYVYAASSSEERNLFAPRALQRRQVADSIALTTFKSSTGGDVVQTLGEWDYPLNRPLAACSTSTTTAANGTSDRRVPLAT
jgi:hypothetical protein